MRVGRGSLVLPTLLTILLCLSSDSALGADFFIHLESAVDADELTRSNYSAQARRRFSQSLFFLGRSLLPEGLGDLVLVVQGRIESDLERPVILAAEDERDREALSFNLQLAYLQFETGEALSLRLGRQLLFSSLPAIDLDGLTLLLSTEFGLLGHLGVGREVRENELLIDKGAFDAIGGRWLYFEDLEGTDEPDVASGTWALQGDVGWMHPNLLVRGGHQVRLRNSSRVGQFSAAVGRLSFFDGWVTHLRMVYNHLLVSPDQLELTTIVPVEVLGARFRFGWEHYRPVFDGDSIFNVFPVNPAVTWRLGGDVRLGPQSDLWLFAHSRAFMSGEEVPWLGALEDSAAGTSHGGQARLSMQILPTLRLRLSLGGEGGYGGASFETEAAARWQILPERLELGTRVRWAHQRYADQEGRQLLGTRLRGGYRLTSFGYLRIYLETVSDLEASLQIRAFGAVELDLGPI